MKITTPAFVILALGMTCQSFAGEPFENGLAPVELISEFTGASNVVRGLPDGFPVPPALAGLPVAIVGSIERGNNAQQMLLRSPLGSTELRATLLSAYVADGWTDVSSGNELGLCRDGDGQLYFQLMSEVSGTKAIIGRVLPRGLPVSLNPTCAQLKLISQAQNAGIGYPIVGAMPQLVLPAGAVSNSPSIGIIGGSGSYSLGGIRYRTAFGSHFTLSNYSLQQLFQHLAQQLAEQQWQVDSDGIGNNSGAAVWFKTLTYIAPDGQPSEVEAVGFLKLLKEDDDQYSYALEVEVEAPLAVPSLALPSFGGPPSLVPMLGVRGIHPF